MAEEKAKKEKAVSKKSKTLTKKKVAVKDAVKKEDKNTEIGSAVFSGEYLRTVGRRKRATAQVRLYRAGNGKIVVNGNDIEKYFPQEILRQAIISPLETIGQAGKIDISAKVSGGGKSGQAEAIRHGIARALLLINPTFRVSLKRLGFLTRDPRQKERKKPGLKRARRAPQWSKR